MKKSQYNSLVNIDGQQVLYNALSDITCALSGEVARIFSDHSADEIEQLHSQFFNYLKENGFIVDNQADELQTLIDKWRHDDTDEEHFSLSVNPTLNCNMHCWYCYENHAGNLNMPAPILERICRLISAKVGSGKLHSLNIGFFGGEPLLNFDKVGRRIIDHALEECHAHNVPLTYSFVTNGSLLTDALLDYFEQTACHVEFQITLDGNETFHNQVRKTRAGEGSYHTILNNCAKILAHPNMGLILRCNFTRQNVTSFLDVASDIDDTLAQHGITDRSRLTIDMHQVWQDAAATEISPTQTAEYEENLRRAFKALGLTISAKKCANRYRCYADHTNHALVNYDGNVFRCTARDFIPERAEGRLTADGAIEWNERSAARDAIKWSNPTCRACSIYPLCCGNCSQAKLESGMTSGCYHHYSEADKTAAINERVRWLLSHSPK
jgi:uncharacterized protein